MSKIYEVATINTGGRNGKIYSSEKKFLYDVAAPGSQNTEATNPEELFAAAYSACFNGALELVLSRKNINQPSSVKANVSLLNHGDANFTIEVVLSIFIEGMSKDEALKFVEEADKVCPYSKALRGNVKVTLEVSDTEF
ncbi:osmotically inducible protein C [Enterococcus villorum]|uniref:Osmotically inducible protein C n=1 Tax=Enterococcus villorum TaxID=112904 RepID=A0A1V8YX22_9ENTE|nr:Ohr family peroxiredoxin [Enterococcus villorum]OQO70405.1 osmotically inducible protein C [Enterococcus villorum]OQO77141.1 osmotically inducible protein C [Enterococcus villorum]